MTVLYTFGTESSPIPLSQLDANFAAIPAFANTAGNVSNAAQPVITSVGILTSLSVSGNVNGGNLRTVGLVTATGNVIGGNILTTGSISSYGIITTSGNVAANNINSTNSIQTPNNIIGGNIYTTGIISAQGTISATGNIETAQYFIGNFQGNITGNLSVGGSNTQILFNQNGNVGAAAGLTYTAGPNVFTVLGRVTTTTLQVSGVATAPTAPLGTANNQIATTAFVGTTVGTLGTMARQNAVSVAITGGTIGNGILTLASIYNSTMTTSNISGSNISGSNISGGTLNALSITSIGNNSYGTRTVSTAGPSGGSDGDIWYKI